MIRFLIVSFIIHILFLALLSYRTYDVIENPIVSVEILQTDATQKTSSTAVKPKIIPSVSNSSPSLPRQELTSNTSSGSSEVAHQQNAFYETQQVTKLPRVIKQIKADYPESAKQARVEGPVKLSVLIDPSGAVTEVIILEGPGHGLNETAQKALMSFQFSPAEKEGEKVSVKITYIYRFRLDSR